MTKDEIIDKMIDEMPFNLSENIRPYVKEAMDIYAQQEVKNCNILAVSKRSELLFAFIKEWKEEFKDENWDYLNFFVERVIKKHLLGGKSTGGNFANTLLSEGYSSCEVCFNVKLKRTGFIKWLEDNKIITPKTEGFALMVRNWGRVDILSSADSHGGIVLITNTKVNGLH
jgi:hypothetical protein